MNLPNKLTVARVIAVPFFIAFYMLGYHIAAFVIFIAASLTDMLDGKIARKYNLVTNFGKIMDPLADKILVYSAFCLLIPDYVPGWMLIIILARGRVRRNCNRCGHERKNQNRSSDDCGADAFASAGTFGYQRAHDLYRLLLCNVCVPLGEPCNDCILRCRICD